MWKIQEQRGNSKKTLYKISQDVAKKIYRTTDIKIPTIRVE